MATLKLKLIDLPRTLRIGIERRLPKPGGGRFKDQTGRKYRGYEVLGFAGYKGEFSAWLCLCHCGKQCVRRSVDIGRKGRSGCGCGVYPKSSQPKYIRILWHRIINRCNNPQHESYPIYGGRGIRVCQRWLNSIDRFAADLGPRPKGKHVLCRRNASKDFAPSNCYWGGRDNVRVGHQRFISCNGMTHDLGGWAKVLGISREAMRTRANRCLKNGWDLSWAVAAPIGRKPMREPNE